jgi:hypothetical protein
MILSPAVKSREFAKSIIEPSNRVGGARFVRSLAASTPGTKGVRRFGLWTVARETCSLDPHSSKSDSLEMYKNRNAL